MVKEDVFKVLGHITIFFSTLDILTTVLLLGIIKKEKGLTDKSLKDNMTLKLKFMYIKNLIQQIVHIVFILARCFLNLVGT